MRFILLCVAFGALSLLGGCGAVKGPDTSEITVDDFKKEVVGQTYNPKKKFTEKYGEPTKESENKEGDVLLHYKCKDGNVVVKISKTQYQATNTIAVSGVERR